ncbi:hypothetical protein DFS34DRAFT_75788 [Phlyctochytrium arcticum]|nr:hypothetical protein DFS34DRAFT_75788 [Phlyctochytrium arcticum]
MTVTAPASSTHTISTDAPYSLNTRDAIYDNLQALFNGFYNVVFRDYRQGNSTAMIFKFSLSKNSTGDFLVAAQLNSVASDAGTSLSTAFPHAAVTARLQLGELSNIAASNAGSVLAVVVASIGGMFSLFTLLVSCVKRQSAVLHRSVNPLNYVLCCGIAALFLFPVTDTMQPTRASCIMQVVLMPFSIGLVVSVFMVKSLYYYIKQWNPVALSKGPTKKESSLALSAVFGLVSLYLILMIVWLAKDSPSPTLLYKSASDHRFYTCHTNPVYVIFLAGLSGVMLYLTLKINASRSIPARETTMLLVNSVNILVLGAALVALMLSDFLPGSKQVAVRIAIALTAAGILLVTLPAYKLALSMGSNKDDEEGNMRDEIMNVALSSAHSATKSTALGTPYPAKLSINKSVLPPAVKASRVHNVMLRDGNLLLSSEGSATGVQLSAADVSGSTISLDTNEESAVQDAVRLSTSDGKEIVLQFATGPAAKNWISELESAKKRKSQ